MIRAVSLAMLAAVSAAAGEAPPQPRFDLEGGVLNGATSAPVKKVQIVVCLQAPDGNGASYSAVTGETGTYTLAGLVAGDYELRIEKPGFQPLTRTLNIGADQKDDTVFRLEPLGAIAGRIADRDGDPIAGATVQTLQSRYFAGRRQFLISGSAVSNDLGEYRIFGLNPGSHILCASYRRGDKQAAAYYPSAGDPSGAAPIAITPGRELRAVNLVLAESATQSIRGALRSAPGVNPVGIRILAIPCNGDPLKKVWTAVAASDGAFTLRGVAAGCYVLAADTLRDGKRFSARAAVDLADRDLSDYKLTLLAPIILAGRVRAAEPDAGKLPQVTINLQSPSSLVTASGASEVDGTFVLGNVVPESYQVSVGVPDGYYLKGIQYGPADVLATELNLSNGGGETLEVTISRGGATVSGEARIGADQPGAGAQIVVIPEGSLSRSRQFFKITTADQKGRFSIRDIRPGDYRIYAWQKVAIDALLDPACLQSFQNLGTSLSVAEQENKSLQLRTIPAQ